jgi:predicted AAA+ superfamily ATPase
MKQIFDNLKSNSKLWFDFDNPLDQKLFEDIDYKNIFNKLQKMTKQSEKLVIFIDEIQNYPEITKIIKYLIDHYGVKFIVTGSSNYYMKNLFPESLSGRKFVFDLDPMNFQEYLYFKGLKTLKEIQKYQKLDLQIKIKESDIYTQKKYESAYEDFLEFGGFPGVFAVNSKEEKKLVLKNIFKSFFEKDLKILSDFTDVRELRDLFLLLVPRIGSMLDISKLSSELGVDRTKIYSYLDFLQGVFVIKLLPKYSKSIDRAVAGGKKIYFSDTGLLRVIGEINESQAFENTLVNQLKAYGELSFYNKRNTAEIDFIVDKKYALEAKLTGTVEDLNSLKKLSDKLKIDNYYVISKKFSETEKIISPVVL